MRASERMALLERIGSELQRRYTFSEIDDFLAAMGIFVPTDLDYGGSKRVYAKTVLRTASEVEIIAVARELDLNGPGAPPMVATPPSNWTDPKPFRLFISHISQDKLIATRLKEALAAHGIAGFVAHEDIEPTLEWQDEVERALNTMDAMVAVHTVGFKASVWTQQEVGFALGRRVKIISFKYGEDPVGFIGRHQALPRRSRTAEEIAKEIVRLLRADAKTRDRLSAAQVSDDEVPF